MIEELYKKQSNQNASYRSMYSMRNEDGETNEHTMVHIPIVHKKIVKYSKDIGRLGTDHPDYIMSELAACLFLDNTINRLIDCLVPIIAALSVAIQFPCSTMPNSWHIKNHLHLLP